MMILIIDDHELYRSALSDLLESAIPAISSIAIAGSAKEVMTIAADSIEVSLILLNPDTLSLDKIASLAVVQKLFGHSATIFIQDAGHSGDQPVELGQAAGLVGRGDGADRVVAQVSDLLFSLEVAQSDGPKISRPGNDPSEVAQGVSGITAHRITRRQQEVFGMVSKGLANKEIAARLGIAEGTVKAHVHTLFRALGTTNRTQAALAYVGMMAATPTLADQAPEQAI